MATPLTPFLSDEDSNGSERMEKSAEKLGSTTSLSGPDPAHNTLFLDRFNYPSSPEASVCQ